MCVEIAGSVIANGSANSLTVASPSASRTRIARRGVLARAAKVSPRRSSSIATVIDRTPHFPYQLINQFGNYRSDGGRVKRHETPACSAMLGGGDRLPR